MHVSLSLQYFKIICHSFEFHQELTIFHIASAYSFSALKTLARKLSNAPTISQSLDAWEGLGVLLLWKARS